MITATRATTQLAQRISAAGGLPSAALEQAQAALIDTLGVMLAGSREPAARIVAEMVRSSSSDGPHLIGTTLQASPTEAALANGTSAHALDFDDVSPAMVGHPSAVLWPALLAAAEDVDASIEAVLESYVVGFEVAARLGNALNPDHYNRGWHATATLGAPAAAAAVAHLLQLDAEKTAMALSIAGSLAGGMRVSFGTMVKPLHAGHAARTGVMAARLSAGGFNAAAGLFEERRGFGELFGSTTDAGWSAALDAWSWTEPEILRSGIQVKPFPSCANTHTAIDALLSMRDGLSPALVESIDCRVTPRTPEVLIYSRPTTGLEGKFSMEYCLAVTLLDGHPGPGQFSDERAAQQDVQSLLRRVQVRADPSLTDDMERGHRPVHIDVRLENGQHLYAQGAVPPGSPERPMGHAQLEQKFIMNAVPVLGERGARSVLDALRALDANKTVRGLVSLLIPEGARSHVHA